MPLWVMLTCGDELDVDTEHTAMVALQIVEMSQVTPVMLKISKVAKLAKVAVGSPWDFATLT